MADSKDSKLRNSEDGKISLLREILGYLNFSNGNPDVGFQNNLNQLHENYGEDGVWGKIRQELDDELDRLKKTSPAFENSDQATAVICLTFDHLWPAYRKHHSDLLFHLDDDQLQTPFFLSRLFEAVLSQGGPWGDDARVVSDSLDLLNDFLGYRPLAMLENGRRMEPYDHERYRPVPLYIRDAGVSVGRYEELISKTLEFFQETPVELLQGAHFDLSLMDELAIDVRAHDHIHPANKRTNYMFGEWDPHVIDNKGNYRRFIIRKIIIDAMLDWIDEQDQMDREEVLYDASAVLCGTILMASSISGSGPDTHDSSVSLISLLPKVARQRDAFYARLIDIATGDRAERLAKETELTQQPFGHVRQKLNMHLAHYGALQVEHRFLAQLFARMGFPEESRKQAAVIPSVSVRFETEIQVRLTTARLDLDRGELEPAVKLLQESEELLHRGIECGAIVDPWNILGFQGFFPLFTSREDAIPDERIEVLLDIMERLFDVFSRALGEAAAKGEEQIARQLSSRFQNFATFWDQFASTTVEDLPKVSGSESWESAVNVSKALQEWREAGEAAGDISFWRKRVDQFHSPKAYALVVDALLERKDYVAGIGLMMQWLSQSDEVGLESGPYSIHLLLLKWMNRLTASFEPKNSESEKTDSTVENDLWSSVSRMFDYLEANAGDLWEVPTLGEATGTGKPIVDDQQQGQTRQETLLDPFEEDDEDDIFGAAYEGVTYQDSAVDGHAGDTLDGSESMYHAEFETVSRYFEPRLKFLMTMAQLWQIVVSSLVRHSALHTSEEEKTKTSEYETRLETLKQWSLQTQNLQRDLETLLSDVWSYAIAAPSGDYDANMEYDLQLQTKFFLLHTIIATHINCRIAELSLRCCQSDNTSAEIQANDDQQIVQVYRAVLNRDVPEVRRLLPGFLKWLSKKPLLYVPLDNGGHPDQILSARATQTDIRFLLSQLPRLGMLRETWHLLRTAYRMERASRPPGMVVTEFDRLFRTSLRNSLESLVTSSENWDASQSVDDDLLEVASEIVEHYLEQWLRHSGTTRLSTVEGLEFEIIWDDVKEFVEKYGADLFHARNLTLGNIRAILHSGVATYLDYLKENDDPLKPLKLVEDLENGELESEQAVRILDLIYGSVVDKFDRFLEYNTTTTHSDYGEMFYCFLDFLRLESAYDHDAWNYLPYCLGHEVLARSGKKDVVIAWEEDFEAKSYEIADRYLEDLAEMEQTFGMRLPSVSDRLNERFTKPLAVNRMLALVKQSMNDARDGEQRSGSFETLCGEIEQYLRDTSGSGIDVPSWLQNLEKEVSRRESSSSLTRHKMGLDVKTEMVPVSLREIRQQLRNWKQPLSPKGKKKSAMRPDADDSVQTKKKKKPGDRKRGPKNGLQE